MEMVIKKLKRNKSLGPDKLPNEIFIEVNNEKKKLLKTLIENIHATEDIPQSWEHTMDMLCEKFKWILHLYMKPISFQPKASVVCSVTAAVFIDFCLKKLNVFSQNIGQKTNEYLNSTEQIPRNWNVDQLSILITS